MQLELNSQPLVSRDFRSEAVLRIRSAIIAMMAKSPECLAWAADTVNAINNVSNLLVDSGVHQTLVTYKSVSSSVEQIEAGLVRLWSLSYTERTDNSAMDALKKGIGALSDTQREYINIALKDTTGVFDNVVRPCGGFVTATKVRMENTFKAFTAGRSLGGDSTREQLDRAYPEFRGAAVAGKRKRK